MKCIYMKKFRKWKPIELVQFGEKLLTKNEIQQTCDAITSVMNLATS